jgi:hypothetical protein
MITVIFAKNQTGNDAFFVKNQTGNNVFSVKNQTGRKKSLISLFDIN